jgi:hypothetical protein
VIDFIIINLLEKVYIYLAVAFLLNRKQYILNNAKRILAGVAAILFIAATVDVFRSILVLSALQYRSFLQLIIICISLMLALKVNWLQSLVGVLIVMVTIALCDGFTIALWEISGANFNYSFNVNSQTLLSLILLKALHVVILILILKFKIVIKIPDNIRIDKKTFKAVGSLSILIFLIIGFIAETIVDVPKIRAVYTLSIVAAGAILFIIILQHIRDTYDNEENKAKEIEKNRKKIKNIEICNEIINKKS